MKSVPDKFIAATCALEPAKRERTRKTYTDLDMLEMFYAGVDWLLAQADALAVKSHPSCPIQETPVVELRLLEAVTIVRDRVCPDRDDPFRKEKVGKKESV